MRSYIICSCVCVPFEYMHELIAPVLCGEVVNLGRRCAVIDVHTSSLKMFKLMNILPHCDMVVGRISRISAVSNR